jgi:hypothetical protein
MPISLGTRSRSNIRWGPATVYIADAGTISAITDFGEEITDAALTTLLTSFDNIGSIKEDPGVETTPISRDLLHSAGNFFARQHQSRIEVELVIGEVDNDIANELIDLAEAGTKVDLLWVRTEAAGDYIHFLMDVPFLIEVKKPARWDDIEHLVLRVDGTTKNIKNFFGQKKITLPA